MRGDYDVYSPTLRAAVLAVAAFLLIPVIFIVIYAFNKTAYFSLPPQGLTLKWFANFFSNDRFQQAIVTSLGMAAIVTPVSLIVGIPTAYALVRGDFGGRAFLSAVVMSPLVVPGVITGIAANTKPQTLDTIESPGPITAVLELNAGEASRRGIRVGDKVE